jgi:hypothetical protein
MDQQEVSTFTEFHSVVEELSGKQKTIFRGLSNECYELKTSVGRCEPLGKKTHSAMEKRLLTLFKESAIPHLTSTPKNDWEWLAIAQHHGLPTRLMDWTYNPLAAAFFAVEEECDYDSAVYVFWGAGTLTDTGIKPLEIPKVIRFRPPYVSARIAAQAGLFTAHPDPERPFKHNSMAKIVIKNSGRRQIKKILSKYGVSRRNLFPGLDGLTVDLKWLESRQY